MMDILAHTAAWTAGGAVAAALGVAWRLRAPYGGIGRALRVVILGGGGPPPIVPPK